MSQQNLHHHHHQQQQQHDIFSNPSAGTMSDFNHLVNTYHVNTHQEQLEVNRSSRTRGDDFNEIFELLHNITLVQRPGERAPVRTSGRKNRNEILAVLLARLIKNKHLNGDKYLHEINLLQGTHMNPNNGEFVLVLRTDGRIVVMSDEVEQHFGKSMRSLYTQCINIFECLDQTDSDKLRLVLNSSVDSPRQEHRLVCTFRLPKGKRPSRVHEDVKTITMAGHFYSCHEPSSSNERLFIARCEALISTTTTNKSSSSQRTTMINNNNANSTLTITLNEDMSISMVSSNVNNILGYSKNEMINNWLGRYFATSDLEKFETIRQKYFQQQRQQLPTSICEIFDMYTSNGEGRLTFLCQIRPIRERRSKSIKFSFVAQLIDPSLRNEYAKYIQSGTETSPKLVKAKQVNLVPSSVSKTSEESIMADSPSFVNMAQLTFNSNTNNDCAHQQQCSPFDRSLSNVVAPVNIHDGFWQQLFDFDYNQYSSPTATIDLQQWSTNSFNDDFTKYQSDEELNQFFDEYLNGC